MSELKIYPDKVVQGGRVVIIAKPGAPPYTTGPNYNFKFDDAHAEKQFTAFSNSEWRAEKLELPPGAYKVTVDLKGEIEDPQKSGSSIPQEERSEAFIIVEPAQLTPEYVGKLADRVKLNIDNKLDTIATNVNNLAQPGSVDQLREVAGSLTRIDNKLGAAAEFVKQPLKVSLQRRLADEGGTDLNVALWQTIRDRTNAIQFRPYRDFINRILCPPGAPAGNLEAAAGVLTEEQRDISVSEFYGVDAYNLLRTATEAFLLIETGVRVPDGRAGRRDNDNVPDEANRLGRTITFRDLRGNLERYLGGADPRRYLDAIVDAMGGSPIDNYTGCVYQIPAGDPDVLRNRLLFRDGFRHPLMLELIWSYWLEEGMLVQSMNAISQRFQNKRGSAERDPLAHLEIDPLRPLNNLLWGHIQEEYRRLTVVRRAYEYDHHYGLTLYGKAVPELRSADTRAKFLEAFHNLLNVCTAFFRQADDTTVNADPFPVLNGLREVHLILAEGAHNQFGDLPWTTRAEMLTQQWLLARPEMNEFLHGRASVPYEEDWMGRVDTMKTMKGWTHTSISHFRNLAVFGEQLLLSIRYTNWVDITGTEPARNWALYWRPEIQNYLHAYRAATGVELGIDAPAAQPVELRYMRPSELLRRRLQQGSKVPAMSAATSRHESFRERRATRH